MTMTAESETYDRMLGVLDFQSVMYIESCVFGKRFKLVCRHYFVQEREYAGTRNSDGPLHVVTFKTDFPLLPHN